METIIRFAIGGVVVLLFALIGGSLQPKSFAGLFGAAPSVALATLSLEIVKEGKSYASLECRSMIAGAVALGVYSAVVCWLLTKFRLSALKSTLLSTILWFLTAFGLWRIFLR